MCSYWTCSYPAGKTSSDTKIGSLLPATLLSILHHYTVTENSICRTYILNLCSTDITLNQGIQFSYFPVLCNRYSTITCDPQIIYHISYHSDIFFKVRRRSGRQGIYTFNSCSPHCRYGNAHLSLITLSYLKLSRSFV